MLSKVTASFYYRTPLFGELTDSSQRWIRSQYRIEQQDFEQPVSHCPCECCTSHRPSNQPLGKDFHPEIWNAEHSNVTYTKTECQAYKTCMWPVSEFHNNKCWLKMTIWVTGVLRRTVVGDWRFDKLCESHLQRQVKTAFAPAGYRRVSRQQLSFSGLQSPRRSFAIKVRYSWVQSIFLTTNVLGKYRKLAFIEDKKAYEDDVWWQSMIENKTENSSTWTYETIA